MVVKQDSAVCNWDLGLPGKNVVEKQDGAVRISTSRWPQYCQP